MEEIVHIIPLGWEFDRAVLPIRRLKGHRAYILCHPESDPLRRHYLDMVVRRLTNVGLKCEHVDVDSNLDVVGMLSAVSKIIRDERGKGNRIYVNIASAGKVAAVAVAIAAMAHLEPSGGRLYYPIAKHYSREDSERNEHGIAVGMDGPPKWIPLFRIPLLPEPCGTVLGFLAKSPDGRLGFGEITRRLVDQQAPGFETRTGQSSVPRLERTRWSSAFNKKIVQRLSAADLVEVEVEGREKSLVITESGRAFASLSANGTPSR